MYRWGGNAGYYLDIEHGVKMDLLGNYCGDILLAFWHIWEKAFITLC